MRFYLFAALLFLNLQLVRAQSSQTNTHFQVWLDPTINYNLSPKVRLSNDLYYRTRLDDLRWKQTVLRPGITYALSKNLAMLGGVGWFRTGDHDLAPRNEIRYWAGLQYKHPFFGKINIQHYVRVEERFFSQSGSERYHHLRLRYRVGASYPIKEKDEKGKSSQVLLQYEPFLTVNNGQLNSQFLNTERVYFGVSHTVSPKVRVEAHYILQWGKTLKMEHFEFSDHIVQLKLNYTINPL